MEYTAFLSIFVIGLSYGSTVCMFSCMPFLSPLLVGNSSSTREALLIILPFNMGRIFSYTSIAIVAYLSSVWVKEMLHDNQIFSTILGLSTITMGCFMLYKSFKMQHSCSASKPLVQKSNLNKFGFFTIGATMSINPCAPIMTLLAVAANSSSIYNSIGFGIFFGLGAVLFSTIFYGFIVSTFIKGLLLQFSRYKAIIEKTAALLLIIVGLFVLNGMVIL